MKKTVLFVLLIFINLALFAQQIRPLPSAEIFQKLNQLNTVGTVMYVAAHPDDENTRLISYLVHHDHIRTIYLSLTRGDGGQNILGSEQGSALGLIRTYELLEARKIDGAEQIFSPVIDFGFTKSPQETFQFWDQQKLVLNVVAAIQKYKPDLVICRFPTTGEGGHGQHTASAIAAKAAYEYIEDYNKSHESQLFLPKRLLFNAFQFGRANTIKRGQFEMQINQYDPLLGEGYGELAGRSRSIHKSQGAGTPQSVGVSAEHFELLGGMPMSQSLYDDIDLSWNRVGKQNIGEAIEAVIKRFDFTRPSLIIPDLVKIKQEISTLKDEFWKAQKMKEVDGIILSCAGIMIEAITNQPEATPGSEVPLSLNIISRSADPVVLKNISAFTDLQKLPNALTLHSDSLYKLPFKTLINADEPFTQPYWLEHPEQNYAFQYDSSFAGLPEAENQLFVTLNLSISGTDFMVRAPLSYKYLDPVRGDVVQRLRIVPSISIAPTEVLFLYESGKSKAATVKLKLFEDVETAEIRVLNNKKLITSQKLSHLSKNLDTLITISIPTGEFEASENGHISFEIVIDDKVFDKNRHLIQYAHIPELQYFTEASMKIVAQDWKTAAHKIGYIEGVGDLVDDVLKLSGLEVEMITENEIKNPDALKQYDAIVVGIRAMNTRDFLASGMKDLLHYVKNGGTLIVQYNTNTGLVTDDLGPYPLTLSRDRVTEENAAVAITDPHAAILNFPNKIAQADFKGWVQERGLYFPSDWDSRYKTVFSMHDSGEAPLASALLYTPYGKGQFIYTSLAFFRQLPAGNRGAMRLMMNLLSSGKQNL